MAEPKEFISKSRLDALTDGVFAFAMTLLVVKFDLPEDFHPKSPAELISGLLGLGGTFIAYIVTFLVLASFWLGRARTKEEPEWASGAYAWSVLFHLFFVTLLPFSMIVVGRYDLAPAIWVYGANMVLLALTAIVITLVIERDIGRRLVSNGRTEYGVLIASAIFSVVIGFYSPDSAMYAYFLNLAAPLIGRWTGRVFIRTQIHHRAVDRAVARVRPHRSRQMVSPKAPSPIDIHVGNRLRKRRRMLGMSQEKLARAFGLTFQQIQKYEKGVNRMGASRLQQAADLLGVTVPFFFEGADDGPYKGALSPSYIDDFVSREEGQRLARAFMRIQRPALRLIIVKLVQEIVGDDGD